MLHPRLKLKTQYTSQLQDMFVHSVKQDRLFHSYMPTPYTLLTGAPVVACHYPVVQQLTVVSTALLSLDNSCPPPPPPLGVHSVSLLDCRARLWQDNCDGSKGSLHHRHAAPAQQEVPGIR